MISEGSSGEGARWGRLDPAQTGFDFLVGMSVFLITLGLVLGFVPSMFQPFDSDTGPDMVTADRSAARLTEDLLVTTIMEPNVLNETCTVEFFDSDGAVSLCRFEDDASDIHSALAIDQYTNVNVSIQADGSVQAVGGETLAVGEMPPSTADVVVAKRVVSVGGEEMTLFVRVW